MNPCLHPRRDKNMWSKISDTFPFNYLVDMICVVLILFWLIWEEHNSHD